MIISKLLSNPKLDCFLLSHNICGNHKTFAFNNGHFIDILVQTRYTQYGLNNKNLIFSNPLRYRGYYYDSETNLYYLNSRYYDPEIGRFINADDISILDEGKNVFNGLNLYSYCGNNPIINNDESGESWWKWILAGLSVIASIVISVVTFGSAAPVLVGAGIGALFGGGFEIGKQLISTGKVYDWGAVGLSALGGLVSGSISAIPIAGSGLLSYLGTFALGGLATQLQDLSQDL